MGKTRKKLKKDGDVKSNVFSEPDHDDADGGEKQPPQPRHNWTVNVTYAWLRDDFAVSSGRKLVVPDEFPEENNGLSVKIDKDDNEVSRKNSSSMENTREEYDLMTSMGLPAGFFGAKKQREPVKINRGFRKRIHSIVSQFLLPEEQCNEFSSDGIASFCKIVSDHKEFESSAPAPAPTTLATTHDITKYYAQRKSLFSKFDEGILLDEESWYSVTPERVAIHIASRCAHELNNRGIRDMKTCTVLDGMCGAGGNSIAFANIFGHVISVDMDPAKVRIAKHNAREVYGVEEDKIEFVVGDFFEIAKTVRADIVFVTPPWGGPGYIKKKFFDLESDMMYSCSSLFKSASIAARYLVVLCLPKNVDESQIAMLQYSNGIGSSEMEIEMLNEWPKMVCVYLDPCSTHVDEN